MNKEFMSVQSEISGRGLVLGVAETIVKAVVNFGKMVVDDDPRPRQPVEKNSGDALELLIVRAQLKALIREGGGAKINYPKSEPVVPAPVIHTV